MSLRGIILVQAMSRPPRLKAEADLIAAALSSMPPKLSRRRASTLLARRVVQEIMVAHECTDPLEVALAEIRRRVCFDPAIELAHHAELNLAGELMRERMERFEARRCHQLSAEAWSIEGAEIGEVLVKRFASRFRRS